MHPIITTCSSSSVARVTALGATHTIDYRDGEVAPAVRAICPSGVDCIMDVVSGASATSLLPALAFDGQLASVAGVVTRGGDGDAYFSGWTVHDVSLGAAAYMSQRPGAYTSTWTGHANDDAVLRCLMTFLFDFFS